VRESRIEKRLVEMVRQSEGIAMKLTSPSNRGVPDRLVLMPGGAMLFVEVKAPGQKLRKLQAHWFDLLESLGFRCEMVDSFEGVDRIVSGLKK